MIQIQDMTLGLQNLGIEQPLVLTLIIPVVLVHLFYMRKPGMNRSKWIYLSSRILLTLLILLALSGLYLTEYTEKFRDVASVTILNDKSGSMSLYSQGT
ncbi:MAG: hypothetical protein U9Q22_04460, partial [Candidatus Altiarchaeota archaeon]|nr:hypothetical protein [Candidatus Altiarchaeota archaeon]